MGQFGRRGRDREHRMVLHRWRDVFISFRGKDIRRNFVSHLHAALANADVHAFFDEKELEPGQEISASLLQAIRESRIAIVVFSTNFAGSKWCLEELEEMMLCQGAGMEILPIFFHVEPFEVRHQTGSFGEALENLLKKRYVTADKARKWREILTKASNLSGFHWGKYSNDVDMINDIVEDITMKLDINLMFVAEHPVGVQSRVKDLVALLEDRSNDVCILGLWGMGGSGKTTMAKAIYNEIGHKFRHRSFLANIRETWEEQNGQVNLQEKLLKNILKTREVKLQCVDSGKIKIKKSLCSKRSLVILDDVSEVDQLFALCGRGEWLGPGSRLIFTTRDEGLLNFSRVKNAHAHVYVHVHEMKALNELESLELFSWQAFNKKYPEDNFIEFSKNVVAYCSGLPLALEVLGRHFCGIEILDWAPNLAKLESIQNHKIKQKLKISFDGLNDNTEKEIFLHISCFFIGMDRDYVTQILADCGLHAQIGINTLKERSLVTVDKKNKLGMHDLLRDMGREIIHQQSPNEPGKRSRLWYHKDVLHVLREYTGTDSVEGLALSMLRTNKDCLSTEAFDKMKRLKLLHLDYVKLQGDYAYLLRDLRWLRLRGFPLSYMPKSFYQENLVAIDLKYSNLKFLWKKPMLLEKLKFLNLSHSHYLEKTPDFSKLPNLQKLILKDCPSLSVVHDSIGDLNNLVLVNLKDCTSLGNLPRSFYQLKCLKTLILSGCSKIDKFEEDIEQMESLTFLTADNTAVKQVPVSIVRSKSIAYISLCGYEGLSADVFPSIIWSWMSPLNHPRSLEAFGSTSSIVSIGLQGDACHSLFSNLNDLPKLRSLWVQCNPQHLRSLLDAFRVTHCLEMELTTPNVSQIASGESSALVDEHNQDHIPISGNSLSYLLIQMGVHSQINDAVKDYILQGPSFFLGDNYPHWLTYRSEGSSISFKVPQVIGFTLKGMTFYILYTSNSRDSAMVSEYLKTMLIINSTKGIIQLHKRDAITTSYEDEEWQGKISNLEAGDDVEVVLEFENGLIAKNTTIYLLYGELMEEREGLTLEEDPEAPSSIRDDVEEACLFCSVGFFLCCYSCLFPQ